MKAPVVMIGIGEMGGVFARGLLRMGHPVYPVLRDMDMRAEARALPDPEAVLVTVAENDLHAVLNAIPEMWRDRLVLVQNELLPRDWQTHGIKEPTVISVWFEKKSGQDFKVLIPSPVYGPHAALIASALQMLNIPARILASEDELLFELVRKNLYILTTNIAGLETCNTAGELWHKHKHLAEKVASEVMDIQDWLTGTRLDRATLIAGMMEAIEADPDHKCTGRSAPARLQRALKHADQAGLAAPKLHEIWTQA